MYESGKMPDDAELVCSYDVAAEYEVNEGALYLMNDGTFLHRWAADCSCWDGEYNTEEFETFGDFVQDCWMAHGSDYVFESEFEHLNPTSEASHERVDSD